MADEPVNTALERAPPADLMGGVGQSDAAAPMPRLRLPAGAEVTADSAWSTVGPFFAEDDEGKAEPVALAVFHRGGSDEVMMVRVRSELEGVASATLTLDRTATYTLSPREGGLAARASDGTLTWAPAHSSADEPLPPQHHVNAAPPGDPVDRFALETLDSVGARLATFERGDQTDVAHVYDARSLRRERATAGTVLSLPEERAGHNHALDFHARAVAWSPDGQFLAIATPSCILICNRDLQTVRTLDHDGCGPRSLAWSETGLLASVSHWDLRVWDPLGRSPLLHSRAGQFGCPAWSADGSLAVASRGDEFGPGFIVFPSVLDDDLMAPFPTDGSVHALAWGPEHTIWSAGDDGVAKWDFWTALPRLRDRSRPALSMAVNELGQAIVSFGHLVAIWGPEAGADDGWFLDRLHDEVKEVYWADENHVGLAFASGRIGVWAPVPLLEPRHSYLEEPVRVGVDASSPLSTAASSYHSIAREVRRVMSGHKTAVVTAVVRTNGRVELWNPRARSGKILASREPPRGFGVARRPTPVDIASAVPCRDGRSAFHVGYDAVVYRLDTPDPPLEVRPSPLASSLSWSERGNLTIGGDLTEYLFKDPPDPAPALMCGHRPWSPLPRLLEFRGATVAARGASDPDGRWVAPYKLPEVDWHVVGPPPRTVRFLGDPTRPAWPTSGVVAALDGMVVGCDSGAVHMWGRDLAWAGSIYATSGSSVATRSPRPDGTSEIVGRQFEGLTVRLAQRTVWPDSEPKASPPADYVGARAQALGFSWAAGRLHRNGSNLCAFDQPSVLCEADSGVWLSDGSRLVLVHPTLPAGIAVETTSRIYEIAVGRGRLSLNGVDVGPCPHFEPDRRPDLANHQGQLAGASRRRLQGS